MGRPNTISDLVTSARKVIRARIEEGTISDSLLWEAVDKATADLTRTAALHLLQSGRFMPSGIVDFTLAKMKREATDDFPLLVAAVMAHTIDELVKTMPPDISKHLNGAGWSINPNNGTLTRPS
jgi:hypothetical protein